MRKKKKSTYAPSRGQQLAVVAIVFVFVIVVLAAAFVCLYKPVTPDVLPFDTSVDTGGANTGEFTPPDTTAPDQQDTTSQIPIYTARENVYNFLIVGHDRAAKLADVIMLVNYDVDSGKIAIMQIPRDTYINAGSNVPQINVLFAAYYNHAFYDGEKNPTQIAAEKLAEALEQNLCIQIQYTAVMNLDGFAAIVDAIGGVEIDVPCDMEYEDPDQDLYINIKAGPQTLMGEDAEGFVRFRDNFVQADIGRVNMQKLFLAAFFDKLQKSVSVSTVSELAGEVVRSVTTTISVSDVIYFGKNVLGVDLSEITMLTIPGEGVNGQRSYYVINRADTLKAINAHFNIYDHDISGLIFDKKRVFTDPEQEVVEKAYYAESALMNDEYTADGVLDSPIDVPLKSDN
ncbi:MAG: LCP family protein [Clostridia bacterium]|nr:LCP family protein [Clostridia bacterium]